MLFPYTRKGIIIWIAIPVVLIPIFYVAGDMSKATTFWDFFFHVFLLYACCALMGRPFFVMMGGTPPRKREKKKFISSSKTISPQEREYKFIQIHNEDDDRGMYGVVNGQIQSFDPDIGEIGSQPFDGFGDYVRPLLTPWRKIFLGILVKDGKLQIYCDGKFFDPDKYTHYAAHFVEAFKFREVGSKLVLVWPPDGSRHWPHNSNVLESIHFASSDEDSREFYLRTITNQRTSPHIQESDVPETPQSKRLLIFITIATWCTLIVIFFGIYWLRRGFFR